MSNIFSNARALMARWLAPFARRLAADQRGNVMIIVGASILPLLCLVGSGIDMSRAYMAQARLQQACDAASLAGRRAMTNGVLDSTVTTEVNKFFNFNFPQGTFQTASFAPVTTLAANQTVVITASTTIPTTIMKIFGFTTLPLNVTCNAKQDFVNTDIMLVLDTTGSMSQDVNNVEQNGGPTSKIAGLRSAVLALYDQLAPVQTQLEGSGLRLRYGIVPYSSTVNTGNLVSAVNPAYLNDSTNYQSRVANYTTPVYVGTAGSPVAGTQTYASAITSANCTNYGNNASFSGFTPSATTGGGPMPTATTTTSFAFNSWTKTSGSGASALGTCVRNTFVTTTTYVTRYKFTSYSYTQTAYDTSQFKTGATVALAANNGGSVATSGAYNDAQLAAAATNVTTTPTTTAFTSTTSTWTGCIEERSTDSGITSSSGYTIPSGAYDLNISYIPDSAATRWSPHWPDVEYYRAGSSPYNSTTTYGNVPITNVPNRNPDPPYYACPSPAVRLKAWTRTDLQTYVNSLTPIGGTYHDIGMIWGARLLSPNGIFSADNPNNYNSMPVSRFVIFLTDGLMAPNGDSYSAYGIEYMDKRVTNSATAANQLNDHIQRFKMICNATKSMGASIWVIAFASALDSSLTECASNAAQASTSASQADLIAKFTDIGKNIGALRLTK